MQTQTKALQTAMPGSHATQVANQNNFYGMTAQEAASLAIQLFRDNFPALQEEAAKIVEERARELFDAFAEKATNAGRFDYSPLADPDMQYVLIESQKEYARFGTDHLCDTLTEILLGRLEYSEDEYIKIVLDETIPIAKYLTPNHLNYLSLHFFTKHVKFGAVNDMASLGVQLERASKAFSVPLDIWHSFAFLNMKNLFVLDIAEPAEALAKTYGFSKEEILEILPTCFSLVTHDYGLSPTGIALAALNSRNKGYQLDLKEFLKQSTR